MQPGNVRIHANTISLTTFQFILDNLFAAPTPIIAVVLVWVVLIGIPVRVENKRQIAAAVSAEKP